MDKSLGLILIDNLLGLLKQVTSGYMIWFGLYHNWIHLFADFHDMRTARVKAATLWHVDLAGDFAGGFDLLGLGCFFLFRDDWDGGKQHLRIRMLGVLKELGGLGHLANLAQVHDCYA